MSPSSFSRALLTHFDATRRSMPWRETSDPYAIWVSEVMLQQTRVDTVVPYWRRWMARFPTVRALAEADLDEVLRHWQGLGYYSRARNLHRAARILRERHAGRLPTEHRALRELPGVGEYTAGAVASIAFGCRVPAVDGNVRRVLSRIHDLRDPAPSAVRRLAAELVPSDRPGDFNQALMELGATLCTPRAPRCDACPVASWCESRARGTQEARPGRRERGPLPEETIETAVLIRADGALLLARRPPHGLLAGLWELPGEIRPPVVGRLLEAAEPGPELEPVVHAFTHKRITYRPRVFFAPAAAGIPEDGRDDGRARVAWAAAGELDRFALPVAQLRIARAALALPGRRGPVAPQCPRSSSASATRRTAIR